MIEKFHGQRLDSALKGSRKVGTKSDTKHLSGNLFVFSCSEFAELILKQEKVDSSRILEV